MLYYDILARNSLMHYSTRIEDYLDAINGCDAFFVAEREHFKVINYISMGNDVFPDPSVATDAETARKWWLRRQCRGLVFSHAGDVISLPIMKFFNVNERDETQLFRIDLSRPHVILRKEDGSMIRPVPIGDAYRLSSKMGITDVALMAEVFVADNLNYDVFIRSVMTSGMCPQFEFCSRKQKIVVDYPIDRLILLSIRSLETGQNLPMDEVRQWAARYDVEVVCEYPGTIENIESLVSETNALLDQEGWIIRFLDNHDAIKIKADDYRLKHRAKDSILRENGVIELILNEKLDDVKPVLDPADRHCLEEFEAAFWHGVTDRAATWSLAFYDVKSRFGHDRKAFALEWAPGFEANQRSAIFRAWDATDFDWRQAVIDVIAKNIGTSTKVEEIRPLFGGVRWSYGKVGDE